MQQHYHIISIEINDMNLDLYFNLFLLHPNVELERI